MAAEATTRYALGDVLSPRRIAIVGASRNPRSLAGRYLDHLRKHAFPGEIVPINRTADEVRGLPAVPSLGDVEGPVDCALITVPGEAAFDAAVQAAAMEIPLVVMFSSGFAETGEEGRARQGELTAAFRASSDHFPAGSSRRPLGSAWTADRESASPRRSSHTPASFPTPANS